MANLCTITRLHHPTHLPTTSLDNWVESEEEHLCWTGVASLRVGGLHTRRHPPHLYGSFPARWGWSVREHRKSTLNVISK